MLIDPTFQVIVLPLCAFSVGVFSTISGLGGSLLLVSTLTLLCGTSPTTAISTTLAAMIGMALIGTFRHHRLGHLHLRVALTMLIAALPASYGGRLLLHGLHARWPTSLDAALRLIFIVLMAAIVLAALWRRGSRWRRRSLGPSQSPAASPFPQGFQTAALVLTGLGAGLLAGLLSLGGGLLTVPVLTALLGYPAPVAIGTSIALMAPMAIAATLPSWGSHALDWPLLALLLLGSVPGALLGPSLLAPALKLCRARQAARAQAEVHEEQP